MLTKSDSYNIGSQVGTFRVPKDKSYYEIHTVLASSNSHYPL